MSFMYENTEMPKAVYLLILLTNFENEKIKHGIFAVWFTRS